MATAPQRAAAATAPHLLADQQTRARGYGGAQRETRPCHAGRVPRAQTPAPRGTHEEGGGGGLLNTGRAAEQGRMFGFAGVGNHVWVGTPERVEVVHGVGVLPPPAEGQLVCPGHR